LPWEGNALKLYEFIIQPRSPFGTPLKGDTLFGHFCWQARHDPTLLNGRFDDWIALYDEKPFAVFSSVWPKFSASANSFYALKRPDLPLFRLFREEGRDRKTVMKERKIKAGRKWLKVPENLEICLNEENYVSDADLAALAYGDLTHDVKRIMREMEKRRFKIDSLQPHKTINRQTMTTGDGMFSPYSTSSVCYYPQADLALFILINEEATDYERVHAALERIGSLGFGRDASTGQGRFCLAKAEEKKIPAYSGCNALYAMAPVVPEREAYIDAYFTPFTRYGKHGDLLATSRNPFKCPVVMADEGAVFLPKDMAMCNKSYLGRAIRNISKSEPRTVAQGYAPCLPFKLEESNE